MVHSLLFSALAKGWRTGDATLAVGERLSGASRESGAEAAINQIYHRTAAKDRFAFARLGADGGFRLESLSGAEEG